MKPCNICKHEKALPEKSLCGVCGQAIARLLAIQERSYNTIVYVGTKYSAAMYRKAAASNSDSGDVQ